MRAEGSAHKLDHRRLLRRTSISSIPTGIQRLCAISKVTGERSCSSRASPRKECRHVLDLDPEAFNSICRSRCGKWGLVGLAFTSNGVRSKQSGRFDLALPWLAPTGHRQPARADVPQNEVLSAWEREQELLEAQLDRVLLICRGC
jgi:hypothetical protein